MLRVLIVGGDTPIRDRLREWVEAEGGTVTEAATAEQALAQVAADGAPAVVVCDIRLAGRDGLWLAEQLRIEHPEVAVVITTATHEADAAIRSLQAGVVDYLVEPLTRDRVLEALRRAHFARQSRGTTVEIQRVVEHQRVQLAEAFAELELYASSSIRAMLLMLEAREPGAFEHAQRVARLAVNLALALQVDEPRVSDIERAALLHDVGRLALPDTGALEPGAAGQRLRESLLWGSTFLESIPLLAGAAPFVAAVRERYDGTGFPDGLRGEEIPFGARIISVAKAYDELVSGIGQEPVTPVRAREILRVERAPEFDPLVLAAFEALQPGAYSVVTGEPSLKMDPRRRWMRKRLRKELVGQIAGRPARMVDISYGGFRVELPATFEAQPSMALALDIPQFGLRAAAVCRWTKPLEPSGSVWCGAALAHDKAHPADRWRALVDALPVVEVWTGE